METEGLLFQAFIYLLAAVATVPIAKQLGLGSVLGYLLAGVIIGPHLLGLVGHGGGGVMHVAEFGVVMMLFLVGLELRPNLLWRLRGPIVGTGGAQVILTTLVIAGLAAAIGTPDQTGLGDRDDFFGLLNRNRSPNIDRKGFAEQQRRPDFLLGPFVPGSRRDSDSGDLATPCRFGRRCFTLARTRRGTRATGSGLCLVVGVVAAIVAGGRFLIRPVFRYLASIRLHEIFTAAALLLVVGIALAMQKVGLSPALGTFLAGVVLAESEYRHELESDIEPFKGLLLGTVFYLGRLQHRSTADKISAAVDHRIGPELDHREISPASLASAKSHIWKRARISPSPSPWHREVSLPSY